VLPAAGVVFEWLRPGETVSFNPGTGVVEAVVVVVRVVGFRVVLFRVVLLVLLLVVVEVDVGPGVVEDNVRTIATARVAFSIAVV